MAPFAPWIRNWFVVVRGHIRSLKIAPFDRTHTSSYYVGGRNNLQSVWFGLLEMETLIAKRQQRFVAKYVQSDNVLCQLFAHVESV